MQFLNVLLLSLAAASVNATCWKKGAKSNQKYVSAEVPTVCNYLAGEYQPDEERYVCVVDSIGVKWNFNLKRVSGGGNRKIDTTECQDGMNKETSCEYGGVSKYYNWQYTADPNSGKCTG